MLLSALRAYAEKNKELPDFHARQPVRFRIDLDAYGKFVSATAVSDPEQPKRGVEYVIPYMTRTSSDVPLPLDKGEYVLGIAPPKKENGPDLAPRAAERHRLYVELLEQAAAQTGLPGFSAQHAFVSAVDINAIDLPVGFDPTQFVAVYVDGLLPTADPIAERWWASRQTGEGTASSAGGEELPGVCGVCGKPAGEHAAGGEDPA